MSVSTVNGFVFLPHPPDWVSKPVAGRSFLSSIAGAVTGAEDRSALRPTPYQSIAWRAVPADLEEQSRIEQRVLAAKKAGNAAAPWWGRGLEMTAAASADTVTVNASPWLDALSPGDFICFLGDRQPGGCDWEAAEVLSIAGTTITLTASVAGGPWPSGSFCYPIIFGRFSAGKMDAVNGDVALWTFTVKEPVGEGSLPVSSPPDTDPEEERDGAASIESFGVMVGFVDETGGAASIESFGIMVGFVDQYP